ncbi:MAG TPA: PrpF domain-containing protein [Bauldia sp.]|nr:PrpF domain-containing protein [Bauldia sp.]
MTAESPARRTVPCVVMRGGTTRGYFFHAKDLPAEEEVRDRMFLDVVAGRDQRQADGLGAPDMLLSKVVTVSRSRRPDADVDCTFGAITPGSARVKYGSNCGNLVSAVALFAAEEGLPLGQLGTVRLFNPPSGARVDARFMPAAEFRQWAERVKTAGMATTGVPVELAFHEPAGTIGRGLLPTGRAVDRLRLPSGVEIDASIVDSGTAYVFVHAADLGLGYATEKLDPERQAAILAAAETLRGQAAVLCGLVDRAEDARRLTPAVPKVALVSPPQGFTTDTGRVTFETGEIDMLGRIVSSQSFHNSFAVTGALATIAASVVPNSVVNRVAAAGTAGTPLKLRIGHPGGSMELRQDWHFDGGRVVIDRAFVVRTARRLMTGSAYVPDLLTLARPTEFRLPVGFVERRVNGRQTAPPFYARRAGDLVGTALTFPQGNSG